MQSVASKDESEAGVWLRIKYVLYIEESALQSVASKDESEAGVSES